MSRMISSMNARSSALAQRVSRRAGLGAALVGALGALAAPELGEANKKRRTFCLNGVTVKAKNKKKKNRLKRQGATRGVCPCATGQKLCNGACIADSACCTNADCASGQTCDSGTCITPACGSGGNCTVFTTSTTSAGNLGGLDGADATCQSLATAAGLTGTYMAYLADSTETPATRFSNINAAGPYVLVSIPADGANPPPIVAADFAALTTCAGTSDPCLQHAINRTETGGAPPVASVWTGLKDDGTAIAATCSDWADPTNGSTGQWGDPTATNFGWVELFPFPCNSTFSLYCFEQA